MVFPLDPVWILLLIAALLYIDYCLIYYKINFIIEGGIAVFSTLMLLLMKLIAGIDLSLYGMGYLIIFIFFSTLLITTIRILKRHELGLLTSPSLSWKRKGFVLTSLVLVIGMWSAIVIINPDFSIYPVRERSAMKNLGTALEMYAMDYQWQYPASLDPLIPKYIKEISPATYVKETTKSGVSIMEKDEKNYFCSYEVNQNSSQYTLTCAVGYDRKKSERHFLYTSQKGFSVVREKN